MPSDAAQNRMLQLKSDFLKRSLKEGTGMQRKILLNQEWHFGTGVFDLGDRARGNLGSRTVNLPHDFMIETDVYREAPSGASVNRDQASSIPVHCS